MVGYPVRPASVLAFCLSLLLTLGTGAAAAGTTQAIPGDFNGDGIPDALFQPSNETSTAQIVLGDASEQLTIPAQTIAADYLGLSWGQDQSNIITGDFIGNGRDDIFVQALTPGGRNAILLTDSNGQVHAINQQFSGSYMGLDWSAASHHILVGDFTGNGRQDVLLQTAVPGGMNLIALPDVQGRFNTTGQEWPDGFLGLQWSSQAVTLYSGDFTGNGRSDLLVQVNDPAANTQVPAYALLLSDGNGNFTQINQSWGTNAFGADWSPATHALLIEDVAGNGMDDIVLMAKDPSGTNYLFLGNQTGTFSKPDLVWTGTESA
ncbi:MAG: FG-GAP repeat domain-containing protein, partial [Gammaproteobacteria bacterium]